MQQTKDGECRASAALRISSRESIGEVPCRESGTHAGASENGSAAVPIGENASRKFEIWMWGGGMRETSLTVKLSILMNIRLADGNAVLSGNS